MQPFLAIAGVYKCFCDAMQIFKKIIFHIFPHETHNPVLWYKTESFVPKIRYKNVKGHFEQKNFFVSLSLENWNLFLFAVKEKMMSEVQQKSRSVQFPFRSFL